LQLFLLAYDAEVCVKTGGYLVIRLYHHWNGDRKASICWGL